jgi:hypothetical protein
MLKTARPTVIGLAPPKTGSAPEPTRKLTPVGRYRVNTVRVETVKLPEVKKTP